VIRSTAGLESRKINVVPPFFMPGRTTVREARTGLRCSWALHGCGWQLALLSGPTVDPELPLEPGDGAAGALPPVDPVDAGPLSDPAPL
jgi:hypothetical protein